MKMKSNSTVSSIFVGRWTVRILFSLQACPHRHAELRRRLEGVSQRMLTKTLRNLQATGLIGRREIKSKVMGVEYSLTDLGRTFIRPLDSMCRWARENNKDVSVSVRLAETTRAR